MRGGGWYSISKGTLMSYMYVPLAYTNLLFFQEWPGTWMLGDRGSQEAQQQKGQVLEIDIVMSSSLFLLITYYSVVTDTNKCD